MTRQTFKLDGAKELVAQLKAMGEVPATKVGVKAARKATTVLKKAAQDKAPYATHSTVKTWTNKDGTKRSADYGHLKNNIKVRKRRSKALHTVSHVVTTGNAFWAYFLEFGTVHMKAQPFFKPAIDGAAQEAIDTLMVELRKAILAAAKKGGRA